MCWCSPTASATSSRVRGLLCGWQQQAAIARVSQQQSNLVEPPQHHLPSTCSCAQSGTAAQQYARSFFYGRSNWPLLLCCSPHLTIATRVSHANSCWKFVRSMGTFAKLVGARHARMAMQQQTPRPRPRRWPAIVTIEQSVGSMK